jgi:hypothetical protein
MPISRSRDYRTARRFERQHGDPDAARDHTGNRRS